MHDYRHAVHGLQLSNSAESLLKTVHSCDRMTTRPSLGPNYASVTKNIDETFNSPHRTRMLARLLENQTLDAWMRYELMEEAIAWVRDKNPLDIKWQMDDNAQTYNLGSSTTADLLSLKNTPVDSFYNFHTIKVDGGNPAPGARVAARHQSRPDGMFLLKLDTSNKGPQNMVLFYEGEVHGKDTGKSLDEGCKNSHKMYQAIAQAQSANADMAGCVIFAAMQHAPTDNLMTFLDDMLKAHIFMCIAIADWNSHVREEKRVVTLIGNLFGNTLHHSTLYDFVFGINIGLESGDASFNTVDFDDRIEKMLESMNFVVAGNTIQLQDFIKKAAPYHKKSTKIGCVQIVICAIPRKKADFLSVPTPTEMFIYPLHIEKLVKFRNDVAQHPLAPFDRFLDIAGPNLLPANYNFKKNMMHMTTVYVNNNSPGGPFDCNLNETDGFFFIALPLAYYTIQQFEVVNTVLKYDWSPTKVEFSKLVRIFKANKQKLTGDLQVTMFKENKGTLFHIICHSARKLQPISKDFELFLKECCRWRVDADAPKYSSPTIIFRTLGIFSLQNAIDFACDLRSNPNKEYSSLLASYPVGAQMLIQQCIKKLSSNEAYAYIGRDDANDAKNPQTQQPADSDDDDDDLDPIVKRVKAVDAYARSVLFHSTWKVAIAAHVQDAQQPASATAQTPPRVQVLAKQLLRAYEKSVVQWTIRALGVVEATSNTEGQQPSEDLSKILTDFLSTVQIAADTRRVCNLKVAANLFDCNVDYRISCRPFDIAYEVTYICTPLFPGTLNLPTDTAIVDEELGTQYTALWGRVSITFTLQSRSVQESAMQGFAALFAQFKDSLTDALFGPSEVTDDRLRQVRDSMKRVQQEMQQEEAARQQTQDADSDAFTDQENETLASVRRVAREAAGGPV